MEVCYEALGVSLSKTALGADLEDRSVLQTQALPRILKGNGVNVLQPRRGITYGSLKEFGTGGGSFGKRRLLFSS